MNSRKRSHIRIDINSQIKEEITSPNMSIDEDSFRNEHPPSSSKEIFSSYSSSKNSAMFQFPNSNNILLNTQQRPTTNFNLRQNNNLLSKNILSRKTVKNSAFTSKKRKKSKKKEKIKNNKDNNKKSSNTFFEIDDDELDITMNKNQDSTSNKLINEIIQSFNTFNYSEYDIKHYFDDNHLNLTQKTDPYIELKVLCTSENVDLRCVPNSYIIGEGGLNCSMKNHNRDVTTIGRQQINQDMIRPNDIMLFPTDSSLSRCHLSVYHKKFFDEMKKYKKDIEITLRISRRSKYNFLPPQIWFGIIQFLKPSLCLEIQDQGTIYGSYIKVDEISVLSLLINTYILLSDSRGDLFNFFKSDFMYSHVINNPRLEQLVCNSPFISGDLEQINSMPIIHVIQKIFYELKRSSAFRVCNNIREYLNNNLNYILLNAYGEEFSYEYLFNKANTVLKPNQFYLTSNHSGLVISNIGTFGQVLDNINAKLNDLQNSSQNNESMSFVQINVSLLSIGKICPEQKLEPNARIYSVIYNSVLELPDIQYFDKYLNEKCVFIIETEGDPCGVMNHVRIIILLDTLFNEPDNSNAFSILFQRGFVLGKNKYTCLHCPLFDCNLFINYSIQAKCWAINEVSNLFRNANENNSHNNNNNSNINNNSFINEQYFGLYLCTSDDKGCKDRFGQKKYCVKHGDKIKLSDTVLEVKFHV